MKKPHPIVNPATSGLGGSTPSPLGRIVPICVPLSGVGPLGGGLSRLLAKATRQSGRKALTKKDQLFIAAYLRNGSRVKPALREAFPTMDEDDLDKQSQRFMTKASIKAEIARRIATLDQGGIASREEIQRGLTEDFRNPETWQQRHSASSTLNKMDGHEAPIHHIHDHNLRDGAADLSMMSRERRKELIGRHGAGTLDAAVVKREVQLLEVDDDDDTDSSGPGPASVPVPPVPGLDGDS